MKSKNRNLPRLNQLFLQRKKYDAHLQKIEEIKSSKKHFAKHLTPFQKSSENQRLSAKGSNKRLSSSKNTAENVEQKMEKIDVSIHQKDWMTPFDKKRGYEISKENKRLHRKIKNPHSKLDCWRHNSQIDDLQNLKRRIRKYEMGSENDKIVLKTQKSYERLNSKKNYLKHVFEVYTTKNQRRSPTPHKHHMHSEPIQNSLNRQEQLKNEARKSIEELRKKIGSHRKDGEIKEILRKKRRTETVNRKSIKQLSEEQTEKKI